MKDALTLSDVLTRRLSLQWSDGIAIVRGVAERLLEQQGVELRIPELHQIELDPDGSVMLAGGGSAKDPVRRLGQLLQALLNDAEVPVQLRLADLSSDRPDSLLRVAQRSSIRRSRISSALTAQGF